MEIQNFIYLGESIFKLFGIPVRLYEKNKIIKKFDQFSLDDNTLVKLKELFTGESTSSIYKQQRLSRKYDERKGNIQLYTAPNLLTYGIVRDKSCERFMHIGPSRASIITELKIKELFIKNNLDISIQECLIKYLNSAPVMQTIKLAHLLSNINLSINQEIIEISEFYDKEPEYKINPAVLNKTVNFKEQYVYNEITESDAYFFEKKLIYYVRNGMTGALKKLWLDNNKNTYVELNTNILRDAKNDLIMSIGIISRAAMYGGFDSKSTHQLCEVYMLQTENCSNTAEVAQLKYNMMLDFCEHVREHQQIKTDNPVINRAIQYILENIERKITLNEIAQILNMSSAYLSTKFKEAAGMSLPDFINLQKINESKSILLLTDKPLSEIANYFSFSTQSYFQAIFKKFTGMTPTEFRAVEAE